jgi:hypothetical protein
MFPPEKHIGMAVGTSTKSVVQLKDCGTAIAAPNVKGASTSDQLTCYLLQR